MIETNRFIFRFFLQQEGVNIIQFGIKRDPTGSENDKKGVNPREIPYHLQVWECPLGGFLYMSDTIRQWVINMHFPKQLTFIFQFLQFFASLIYFNVLSRILK